MPPCALIEALFEGVFETPLWGGFLDRLRAELGADYASIIFRPPAPARPTMLHLWSGEAAAPALRQLYRDRLHERDPVPYHALAEGRVHALESLLDEGAPFRAFMAAAGMNFVRQMRIVEPTGVNAWLSVSRRAGNFPATDDTMIEGLAPWFRTALRTWVALERERFAAALSGEAAQRLNFGWLALDADGQVLDNDAQGARILESAGLLVRGRLGRAVAAELASLLADPKGRSRAMTLSRDPWVDMLLVPASRHPVVAGPAPVIAYVHAETGSSADSCEQLAQLFGLLPSEARMALALSRGMTIAEAAAELGLTVGSARIYSKRIYAKMGARGQTDLVRFVLRSVLAIA